MNKNDNTQMMPPMSPGSPQADIMQYRVIYPELYYRLQPYIISACDEMDSVEQMPSQNMIESMSDCICDEILRMYPDYADYIKDNDDIYNRTSGIADQPTQATISPRISVPRFRPRSRRRGLFRDFIDILLLSELTNRRRRRRYYYY